MASFNPQVPDTRDPNYLQYSRAIPQPESDKTAAYSGQVDKSLGEVSQKAGESAMYQGKASEYEGQGLGDIFKNLGTLFTEGVHSADAYVKKTIDNSVYSAVDAERNEYTSQLEKIQSPQQQDIAPGGYEDKYKDPQTGKIAQVAAPMSLIDQEQSAPQGIQSGLNRIDTIVQARANDKMTETGYIGNLNSIVKGLRAQYPGYREYIDQKVSETTGMIPANAYIKSLIQDINASVSASKGEFDKTEGMLRDLVKQGVPGATQAIQAFRTTGNVPAAESFANKTNAQKYYWETESSRTKFEETQAGGDKLRAGQNANLLASQHMDNFYDNIAMQLSASRVITGAAPGTGTARDLVDLLTKQQQIKNGAPGQGLNPEALDQMAGMLRTQGLAYKNAVRADAIKKGIYGAYNDPEGFEKRLDAYGDQFTKVADLIQNEKYGLAGELIRQNKNIAAIDQNKMMTQGELQLQARMVNAFENWPNASQKLVERLQTGVKGPDGKTIMKPLPEAMTDYIKQQRGLMQLPMPELLQKGAPQSPRESIQKINMKTSGSSTDGSQTPAQAVNLTLGMVHDITDPKVELDVRARSAQAAFQNSNRGMLNEIQKDYVNRNGQKVRGQMDVYKDFSSPQMTDSIAELNFKTPGLMNQYRSWAKDEFTNVLLRQDLTSLRDVQGYKGMVITYGVDNNGKASFGIAKTPLPQYDPQDIGTRPDLIAERRMKAEYHIDRINQALDNYSYIVKKAGGDINADMVDMLSKHGVNPTQVPGLRIPEGMLNAVLSNGKKPESTTADKTSTPVKTETIKALPFSAEDGLSNAQRGTLGDYLRNPASRVAPQTQNAPEPLRIRPRGTVNLTDQGDQLGIKTTNIPEGMSPAEAIKLGY